ncbi:DUF3037 domain-containing protein [Paucibacter sp. AS339]|uniref:DUF3037 domain-containing protein n=1 Tax=Paucibacter hankyongi TaxID=3133434 RepID=UPI0030A10828
MKKFACRYAIVQFLPYSETGEFANVGLVLTCPTTGFFEFKLEIRKYGRVTGFFDELPADVYRTAMKLMEGELTRVRGLVREQPSGPHRADQIRALLDGLAHPREAIVRFGAIRPVLTDDPQAELGKLFEYYVDRSFATPEYVEHSIAKRLHGLIAGLHLSAPFKAERIGDDQIHANFPLVQRQHDQVAKVIKPFNLAQSEANGIFDHGDAWLQKIRRLRKRQLLPRDVLFAVAVPPVADTKRFSAYQEICGELRMEDVQVVEQGAESVILDFAAR